MKQLKLVEIQQKQLAILDYVVSVCEANDIQYYIIGGTLIGAVRHKGFIPWDDDIDLFMKRDQYEKFLKCFPADAPYNLKTHQTDALYYYPFGKVEDKKTLFIENAERFNMKKMEKLGVNIDIFPLDYAPENIFFRKALSVRKNILKELCYEKYVSLNKRGDSFLYKIIRFYYEKIKGVRSCSDYLEEISRLMRKQKVTSVLYDSWVDKFYKAEWFASSVKLDFESRKLDAPSDWDGFLTYCFGDYMTPHIDDVEGHGKAYEI